MEAVAAVEGVTEAEEGAPTVVGLRPQEKTEATLLHGTGWCNEKNSVFRQLMARSGLFNYEGGNNR